MMHRTLRNAGLASITALSLALVACGGSSSSTPATVVVYNAPIINNITQPAGNVVAGHTGYSFIVMATGGQSDDTLTVTATVPTGKGSATVTGTTVTYVPPTTETALDTVQMTVTVANQHSKSTSLVVPINVYPDAAPVFTNGGVANVSYVFGTAAADQTINMVATDLDRDTVTYATTGTWPTWATLNTATGLVTLQISKVPATDLGAAKSLVLTASDGFGGTVTGTINVTVTAATIPFNVTNVTQPNMLVAGRTYPNDGLTKATSTDLPNNRFTAYCDYPVTDTDVLTWSFIYNGTTIAAQKTTGHNGATTGAFVEFGPVTIPLSDYGATRFYSVQVQDAKGNVARSNTYPVTPWAPTFPWVYEVDLNDVRDLRGAVNGVGGTVYPVWNAPATSATLIGPKQNIDLYLSATDVPFNGPNTGGLLPLTFKNPKAYTQVGTTLVALKGAIAVTQVDSASANLVYSPAQADYNKIPLFTVDVTNAAGMTTTMVIKGESDNYHFTSGFAPYDLEQSYDGSSSQAPHDTINPAKYSENLLAYVLGANGNGTDASFAAVRDNHAPVITSVAAPNDPASLAAEEGSTPFKVVSGTNFVVTDQDAKPGLNKDFTELLLWPFGKLPSPFFGPCTVNYATGYFANLTLTPLNGDTIDTTEVTTSYAGGLSLTWNPSHPNVRKELQFSVNAADLYDAVSTKPLTWTTQVSAMITGQKADTVFGGSNSGWCPTAVQADAALYSPWFDTTADGDTTLRKIHFWPVRTKGTVGAISSPAAPYPTGVPYGFTGPSEFGVLAAATTGIFVTPTTNNASPWDSSNKVTTAAAGTAFFTSRGLTLDNTAANPTANVVPYGYYLVKVDDTRTGFRYKDMNARYFFSNVTDGLDLSKAYIGRDIQSGTPAVLGANATLRIASLNGLTAWDVKHSALQYTEPYLSAGNVFLGVGALVNNPSTTNVLDSTKLQLPFPGVHDMVQNIAPAAATNSALTTAETGTSNGALLAKFDGLQSNVYNAAKGYTDKGVIITQLSPMDIAAGSKTIHAMAVTKYVNPIPAPLGALATGTVTDFLNTNTTASTAPSASWFVNVQRSAFYSALTGAAGVKADTTSFAGALNENYSIYQTPSPAAGFEKNAPLLFNFQNLVNGAPDAVSGSITVGTDLNLGSVNFGNPFTTGTTVAEYFTRATVNVFDGINGAGNAVVANTDGSDNGTFASVGYVTATPASATAADAPGITPVTGVTFFYTKAADLAATPQTATVVDIANAQTSTAISVAAVKSSANGTPAFTLSWTAPAAPNYSGADVELWSYTAGNPTTRLYTFTTGGNSVMIPASLMPTGSSYFFRIRAYYMNGVNFNTTPLARSFPMYWADFVTQAIPMGN